MFQLMSFVSNHFVSVQLGSQAHMMTQSIGFAVMAAKMVSQEATRIWKYENRIKPKILERREMNYPDVRLDINGVPKFQGHTLH